MVGTATGTAPPSAVLMTLGVRANFVDFVPDKPPWKVLLLWLLGGTMGKNIFVLFLASFAMTASASAESGAFDREGFVHQGLLKVKSEVVALGRQMLPRDAACPAGGIQVYANISSVQDSMLSAVNTVDNLMEAVKATADSKQAANKSCGPCQQNNLVSSVASISPIRTNADTECQARPAETFQVNVQSKNEIKRFTEDLLKARSSEGKKLLAGCPDPCAYYINTAQTALDNGTTHITMTVQCGPPRRDSIFSAVYEYQAGIIHQWSCSK